MKKKSFIYYISAMRIPVVVLLLFCFLILCFFQIANLDTGPDPAVEALAVGVSVAFYLGCLAAAAVFGAARSKGFPVVAGVLCAVYLFAMFSYLIQWLWPARILWCLMIPFLPLWNVLLPWLGCTIMIVLMILMFVLYSVFYRMAKSLAHKN